MKLQIRNADSLTHEGKTISGRFSVYSSPTKLGDGIYEVIEPGAFVKDLQTRDLVALWNHDDRLVLGRKSNGTVHIRNEPTGLYADVDICDTSYGNDVYALIERKDLLGCSIGFIPLKTREEWQGNDLYCYIEEAQLIEISVVTFPQYEDTSVTTSKSERAKEIINLRKRGLLQAHEYKKA